MGNRSMACRKQPLLPVLSAPLYLPLFPSPSLLQTRSARVEVQGLAASHSAIPQPLLSLRCVSFSYHNHYFLTARGFHCIPCIYSVYLILFFCSVSVMYQYVLINVKILLASGNDMTPLTCHSGLHHQSITIHRGSAPGRLCGLRFQPRGPCEQVSVLVPFHPKHPNIKNETS